MSDQSDLMRFRSMVSSAKDKAKSLRLDLDIALHELLEAQSNSVKAEFRMTKAKIAYDKAITALERQKGGE